MNLYTLHCTAILQHRTLSVGIWVAVFTFVYLYLWQLNIFTDGFNLFLNVFSIGQWFATLFALLPLLALVVYRKIALHVQRPVCSQLGHVVAQLMTFRATLAVSIYAVSAVFLSKMYYTINGSQYASILYRDSITKRNVVNDGTLYVYWHAILLGISYGVGHILYQRDHILFPMVQQQRYFSVKGRLPTIVGAAWKGSLGFTRIFMFIYLFLGPITYVFVQSTIGFVSGAMDAGGSRFSHLWNVPLLMRSTLAGVLCIVCWETVNELFDVFFSEPVSISLSCDRPFTTLLEGLLLHKKPLIQRLAYLELWRLTRYDNQWRMALFEDVESRPTGWKQICDACIDTLDSFRNELTGTPTSKITPQPQPQPQPTSTKLTKKPTRGVGNQRIVYQDVLLKKTPRSTAVSNTAADNKYPLAPGSGLLDRVRGWFASAVERLLAQWSTGRQLVWSRLANEASQPYADMERVIWASQALSHLVAASYEEDRYGSVQHDVPRVLECYLACISALQAYQATSPLKQLDVVRGNLTHGQVVHRQSLVMLDVLQNCVYEITTTFYESLRAFEFPPLVAQQLQVFMDFNV
ncbi:nucleoporin protein Ndc1-Nup [Syncephalis plumigaleata]|nr:nucleoporin protein Ndc1-Nup [Syncephalis plumigaleata]